MTTTENPAENRGTIPLSSKHSKEVELLLLVCPYIIYINIVCKPKRKTKHLVLLDSVIEKILH